MDSFNNKIDNFDDRIIQIKIPEDKNYIALQDYRKKKYSNILYFMERNFFDEMINPSPYNTPE